MNINGFWALVDQSLQNFDPKLRDGNMDRQAARLAAILKELPPKEIASFYQHFCALKAKTYRWDLWAAADIIANGCSDDAFMDFRSWLVSRGRNVFEEVVADPESLVRHARAPGVEDVFFEEFQYVPAEVYEDLTGRELPDCTTAEPEEPEGVRWKDERDLEARFPKLHEAFARRR